MANNANNGKQMGNAYTVSSQSAHTSLWELKRAIPQVSEKVLNEELKTLCTHQLVAKVSYPEVPPRVEYSLTDLGKEALPIIEAIIRFGNDHLKNN